jgi:hypothetical protein
MGHLLGIEDHDPAENTADVMAAILPPGVRRSARTKRPLVAVVPPEWSTGAIRSPGVGADQHEQPPDLVKDPGHQVRNRPMVHLVIANLFPGHRDVTDAVRKPQGQGIHRAVNRGW